MSAERPLLVSSALIGPILREEKTVTRRLVKGVVLTAPPLPPLAGRCPYGAVGDVLWVRETARVLSADVASATLRLRYEADGHEARVDWPERIRAPTVGHCLANGVYREAARIFLRVEDVRVERVQDITEEDARAEGVLSPTALADLRHAFGDIRPWHREAFAALWDSLAPAGSKWADNPWVWRIAFKLEAR